LNQRSFDSDFFLKSRAVIKINLKNKLFIFLFFIFYF
jgi:hypothetical protein